MSRFNTLYLGSPADVQAALDGDQGEPTCDELRLALINAMRRIEALEGKARTGIPGPGDTPRWFDGSAIE